MRRSLLGKIDPPFDLALPQVSGRSVLVQVLAGPIQQTFPSIFEGPARSCFNVAVLCGIHVGA